MNKYTIDFDQISDIAQKGVRRAAAFLGIGVNVARDTQFNKYQLSDVTNFRILPKDISDSELSHMKEEFEKWIIVNGLRELVESFAIYIDRIHAACLLMATSKNTMSAEEANTFEVAFERKGIEQKLSIMKSRFGINTEKEVYLASINQARNCITHRNGKVGTEDVGEDDIFHLTWWALDLYIETPSGEKHSITPPYPKDGIFLEDGGTVMMKVTDREIEYKLGEQVLLTPNDLSEICLLFQLSTSEILQSTIKFAEENGIEVNKK